jgi:type II secretory ATPase GspE/PulE/Tfp pilus assembly ATPase PilB-like protein
MVSSQGKLADSKALGKPIRFAAQIDDPSGLDTEQMFRLIDSLLSFEACLYHQVLPLTLEGSRLKLGMVNPEDTSAVDYVYRIVSYMNCSLVRQPITADVHQTILSAYLNYTGTVKSATARVRSLAAGHPASETASRHGGKKAVTRDQHGSTFILNEPEASNLQFDQESPQILESTSGDDTAESHSVIASSIQTSESGSLEKLSIKSELPVLEVQAVHLESPIETLATLPPKNLLQELLARVLIAGIGRLYFERQSAQHGQVLWSQNGVLQSVLKELPLPVFQGVIDELKRLTHMSVIPVEESKQVEIERLYEQSRLLLRLRVMPGTHGEEATLQVLRGAALKFYQQQQLTRLGRDALGIAQQLQRKVSELRERALLNPSLCRGQLDTLPTLNELLESVDHQLAALRQLQT